jgi:hypothetical protein
VGTTTRLIGGDFDRIIPASYEAVQLLSELFKEGHNTKSKINEALKDVNNVKSDVFNNKNISFDENGNRADIQQKILLTPSSIGKPLKFEPIDSKQCSF